MILTPMFNVNTAFSMLTQQERQLHSTDAIEAHALINSSDIIRSRKSIPFSTSSNYRGRDRFGRGKGGRGGRAHPKVCSYCHKTCHLVDTCYGKHGLPPHMRQQRSVNCANALLPGENCDESGVALPDSTQKPHGNLQHMLLSQEQKEALIAILQKRDNT
ncbi:uncharacterized protein DS421_2g52980 [Arachis hypogaea]|nr:uncharacterized protein DS421_2g52980 [Arachis hypogaea]